MNNWLGYLGKFAICGGSAIGMAVALITAAYPAVAQTQTAQAGDVRAEVSFEQVGEGPQFENVRLKVVRGGKTLLDEAVARDDDFIRPVGVTVVDLDGNKEPEIIADFYTGGAHCCTYSLIYGFDSKTARYGSVRQFWGNGGYRLADFDKDGVPEFDSRDDRFAYAFDAYAASGYPPQFWQYRNGKMNDVTRTYRQVVYSRAFELWQIYTELKQEGYQGKGFLAAYVATKYLLGQEVDGWRRVKRAYRDSDRTKYFSDLRRFLSETGYSK